MAIRREGCDRDAPSPARRSAGMPESADGRYFLGGPSRSRVRLFQGSAARRAGDAAGGGRRRRGVHGVGAPPGGNDGAGRAGALGAERQALAPRLTKRQALLLSAWSCSCRRVYLRSSRHRRRGRQRVRRRERLAVAVAVRAVLAVRDFAGRRRAEFCDNFVDCQQKVQRSGTYLQAATLTSPCDSPVE